MIENSIKLINVLSLFDGLSCGRIALEHAGIKVDKYYSSEIDKYAIKASQQNYSDIIQLGDITKWKEWNIDWSSIDLIIAGFPCQAWSFAGKQGGDRDYRGALVHDLIDIWNMIKKHNPDVKYLFENVKMKKEFINYINNLFGCEPIQINSALVSAQNRIRNYWCNWEVQQPKNQHIYLRDILEHGVVDRDKSYCIDANYFKGSNLKQFITKSRRQLVFEKSKRIAQYGSGGQGQRIYDVNGKSVCLSALGGGHGAKTGLYCVSQRGRKIINGKRSDNSDIKAVQRFEARLDEKTNCLTTVQKDNYALEINGNYYVVRKLTPKEYARLQTVPEWYKFNDISNTQIYKMLGNGFTMKVISHILKSLRRYK